MKKDPSRVLFFGLTPISTGHLPGLEWGTKGCDMLTLRPVPRVPTEKSIRVESDTEVNALVDTPYGWAR
jgi:hypothetical protein